MHVEHTLKIGGGYTQTKHLQNILQECFRAVDFPRLCCECKNVI